MGIPKGKCPNCGSRYYGWALLNPQNQYCPKCGIKLDIRSSDDTIFKGYSPFGAEGYFLNPRGKVDHIDESANSSHKEDKDTDVKDD